MSWGRRKAAEGAQGGGGAYKVMEASRRRLRGREGYGVEMKIPLQAVDRPQPTRAMLFVCVKGPGDDRLRWGENDDEGEGKCLDVVRVLEHRLWRQPSIFRLIDIYAS